jgi:spore coat protein CotH
MARMPSRTWLALALLLGLSWPASGLEMDINCGGPRVTLSDGTVWLADGQYTPQLGYGYTGSGPAHETWQAVGGCVDDDIYRTSRLNCGVYRVDVPNGAYVVTLHFADLLGHGVGQYQANWRINGVLKLNHLDLFAKVGRCYACDYRYAVQVTSGSVLLDDAAFGTFLFTQLSAVSVVSHDPDAVAPAAPVFTEIVSGFLDAILNWESSPEEDVAGYRVYRRQLPDGPIVPVQTEMTLVSRFIDRAIVPGTSYAYWVSAVDVFGNESAWAGPFAATPQAMTASPRPALDIVIDPDSLAMLNLDPYLDTYYSCTATIGGTNYEAGVRYRGNVARPLSKKSYKIKLRSGTYENRTKLNLNADMCDPCLMRESLSQDLFQDAGVPAPRTWWRALTLNGEHMGLYCDIEQIDGRFLDYRPALDSDANIYKCEDRLVVLPDSLSYLEHYEKETNEEGSWSDLIQFIETLNSVSSGEFYETFIDCFDFQEYLRYFTVLMAINDGDAIYKNFYLYHDLDDDIWKVIPWDKDLSWGIRWIFLAPVYWANGLTQGSGPAENVLANRVFAQPVLKNTYASMFYELLTEIYPLDEIYPRIDATHAEIETNGVADYRKWYWEVNDRLRTGDEELRDFATNRWGYVLDHLNTLVVPQELYINEFMAANSSTIADNYGEYEDWIEIYNPGPAAVLLSDFYLTDNLRDPIRWQLPADSLQPGDYALIWADEDLQQGPYHANFKLDRNGERIALHKREPGATTVGPDDIDPVDLVFFGPQVADVSRARYADGDYRWLSATEPTPGETNTDWSGTPEPSDGPFVPELQARPNPFTSAVRLALGPQSQAGAIEIYDVGGRLLRRLAPPTGSGICTWDGRGEDGTPAPPGLYWARARAQDGHWAASRRVLLVR